MSTHKGGQKNGDRKSDRCGEGGVGTVPGHLARRQKEFEAFSAGRGKGRGGAHGLTFQEGAFHKPGSNKK
jgi:hypothetical protein